jgi:hypothetical protein
VSALHRIVGPVAALSLLVVPATLNAQRASSTSASTQGKSAQAVESKSAALASELTKLLTAQNLDSIATVEAEMQYVGALYIPGSQLLVVRAKVPIKDRMSYLLYNKMYKDAYADLNSASDPATRILISDLGANGLQFKREKDQPFDMVQIGGNSVAYDGKWGGKGNLSKDEYAKSYETSDEQYTQMLETLIAALKKSS